MLCRRCAVCCMVSTREHAQPGQEQVAAVSQAPPHRDITGRSLFTVLRRVRNQDVAHPLHAAAEHGSVTHVGCMTF
jgi:hypothetical protein